LRTGQFDVLIGVNLLREGLDLPEVSLVAILDADKEGFLRSTVSLTQTAGRAARNLNGLVIMYADRITRSMQQTIDETNRRREKQLKYNEDNGITPQQIIKAQRNILSDLPRRKNQKAYVEPSTPTLAADPIVQYMGADALEKLIQETRAAMKKAASDLDFIEAARLRDEMFELEKKLKSLA
jgi:excinuclease ABC subunit B